jgi:YidC/Oxa1 family membrane protein insertase
MNFIINGIYQFLAFLTQLFGGNLAFAIIALTLLIRFALLPLVIPSMKSIKKMQELKPQLDKLKAKYKNDSAKLQKAQVDLYKQNGVNPLGGCLPQLAQFVVLIALYQVFIKFLSPESISNMSLNARFLWMDLTKPDQYHILPVIAGLSQFVMSLMMQTGLETHIEAPKKEVEKKKEEDKLEMAQMMQQQTLFVMPFITLLFALSFPSGITLYWVVTTIFSVVQQYVFSGPGAIVYYKNKFVSLIIKGYGSKTAR